MKYYVVIENEIISTDFSCISGSVRGHDFVVERSGVVRTMPHYEVVGWPIFDTRQEAEQELLSR